MKPFFNGKTPTGKILIYSDFRGDSGVEAIEQVLQSNGYSLFNQNDTESKSLRYTLITGSESSDQRRINKVNISIKKQISLENIFKL